MVKYLRLNDHANFDALRAPALLKHRPDGIRLVIDSREISSIPALLPSLEKVSETLVAGFQLTMERHDDITLGCQIHRVRSLPMGRLLRAEIVDGIAHVEIRRNLLSADLASAISALGTNLGHYLV